MRILHVIKKLDPDEGGPPMVATRLASAQASLGHQPEILSYHIPGAEARTAAAYADIPGFSGVRVNWLDRRGRLEPITARRARRALPALVGRFDVLHLHGVWDPILLSAGAAARRAGVPYGVAPHGVLDPWSLAQRAAKKRLALALGAKRLLDRAAFLHCSNRDEERLIAPLGVRAPCEIIPNGVFIEEFDDPPSPEAFHAAHPRVERAPFVLFLSRLHFKKGLDYLADAFAILAPRRPDLRLVVVGNECGYKSAFEQRVAALGLSRRVHVLDPLYGQAKLAAYAAASVFCLPSRQEAFSMAITEAMAARLPVVVSDACHFPEVEEEGAGRVVECDPARISAALEEILADPALRQRMGTAGRRLVESRFTWRRIAEAALDAYRRRGVRSEPESADTSGRRSPAAAASTHAPGGESR